MKQKNTGFTLVEILFVVVIAAGILVFVVPSLSRAKERSNYQAATGMLLDLGSAIEALQRDLKLQGANVSFPSASVSMKMGNITAPSGWNDNNKKTLRELTSIYIGNDGQKMLAYLLLGRNYLESFKTLGDYEFYVGTGGGTNTCNGRCASGALACMCKSGTTNGCYYGAYYTQGGKITRITADNTSCTNTN